MSRQPASRRARVAVVASTVLSGCTDVAESVRDDRVRVEADIAQRAAATWIAPDARAELRARYLAAGAEALTDAVAVQIALFNNHRLSATLARFGIARSDVERSGLLRNPRLTASATSFSGGTEFGLTLLQPILELFHRPTRQALAGAALAAAEAEVTAAGLRVVFAVRRALVELRAARDVLAVQRLAVETADSARTLMDELQGAGNTIEARRTEQEIVEARARLATADAELAEHDARTALDTLLGLTGAETAWRLEGPLADAGLASFELGDCETRAVRASLDLRRDRALAQRAAQVLQITEWQGWFDNLAIGPVARKENEDGWGYGPVLELPLPLFDRGDARSAAAALELQALVHEHAATAIEVRSTARRMRERVRAAAKREQFTTEVLVPLHERLLRETIREYNGMQLGAFAVFRRKLEHLAAQRDQIDARRVAWLARLDLEQLFAGSLEHERVDRAPRLQPDQQVR